MDLPNLLGHRDTFLLSDGWHRPDFLLKEVGNNCSRSSGRASARTDGEPISDGDSPSVMAISDGDSPSVMGMIPDQSNLNVFRVP